MKDYSKSCAANSSSENVTHLPDTQEGIVEGYELFPSGEYTVEYHSHELMNPKGLRGSLLIWFVITDGDHSGEMIPFFCNVKILNRRIGSFSCRKSSKYFRTMTRLLGVDGRRKDRLPPSLLRGMKLVAEAVIVDKRQDGTQYETEDRYSRIDRLEQDSR